MGFIRGHASWRQRNDYLEDRPARLAFEFDGAMVLLDEGSCEREAESGAAFATRHERKEDPLAQGVWNAGPVVLDMQFQCQTVALLAERHLADDARSQRDPRGAGLDQLGERLGGVAGDVEDRLDQLLAVA